MNVDLSKKDEFDDRGWHLFAKVESLILKAEQASDSNDALKFSQAACNAANAAVTIAVAKQIIDIYSFSVMVAHPL